MAAYAGNATEAARKAGYSGDAMTLGQTGHQLLKNPKIAEAIAKRESKRESGLIATREEVEERLTLILREGATKERLQAIALMAKMRGWNLQKLVVEGRMTLEQLIQQAEAKNRETNVDASSRDSGGDASR